MNNFDDYTSSFGHIVDIVDSANFFCPGIVYFVDRGNKKMNEALTEFMKPFENSVTSDSMMFDYHLEVISEKDIHSIPDFEDISLITAVVPCKACKQLLVHEIKDSSNVSNDLLSFIYEADNYSASVIKSRMISKVMDDRNSVLDWLSDDFNYNTNVYLRYNNLQSNHRVNFDGSQDDDGNNAVDERESLSKGFEDLTSKFIEGNTDAEELLYQRLKEIDSHVFARIIMNIMEEKGFEASKNLIPYFVDYYMGVVETKTKVAVKSFTSQTGTDGMLRVVFKSNNSNVELPVHFAHKESSIVYILLLKAHLDKKSGPLRELVERNAEAFMKIGKSVYKLGDKDAATAYKKVIVRMIDDSTKSKAESKLKLCKNDINNKVQELLKGYDNPFPFMIDGKKGRLYVPDEMIELPDDIMQCKIV
jgi:hypothetical protein